MTIARIFDGITDPLISLLIDSINTRFGKLRLFMSIGWLLEAIAILAIFKWSVGGNYSVGLFMVLYLLYYVGYTMQNMAGQMISPVVTNDPKQRPMVGVVTTIYTYIISIVASMMVMVVFLPKYGNEYTSDLLSTVATLMVAVSFFFLVICLIAISPIDKTENFIKSTNQHISIKAMINIITQNTAIKTFIVAATSDKLAMQIGGQAIVGTVLYGIIIGNMGLSAILNMIAIIPSFIFSFISAKYTGEHGSCKSVKYWTWWCIIINIGFIVLMLLTANQRLLANKLGMAIFVILTMLANGLRVAVSTGTSSMLADVVDYEAYRSGNYMPATISGIYGFIDKLVSSLGAVIATSCMALVGYTTTAPQPTDEKTMPIVLIGVVLVYIVPIIGWICTLVSLRYTPISKEMMVEVQKSIKDIKEE